MSQIKRIVVVKGRVTRFLQAGMMTVSPAE
jgi:hypothetical protein